VDVQEAILTTRAIRRFRPDPVTDDDLLTCLRAAVQAPSGGNIQPWQFLVVTEPRIRRDIGALYARAYDRYERALLAVLPPFRSADDEESFMRTTRASRHLAEHLAEVPALVLFLMPDITMTLHDADGPLDVGTPYSSVYPAVQNFMIAARGLGLGTTLTTVYRIHHDELRELCGVPERYQVVALVPVGRPRGHFGVARRRPVGTLTHWNRFGEKR
jgi:nitroreductase